MDSIYKIRTMTRNELVLATKWAAAEGWNPGLHDADYFYAADPNGFLMGFLDDEPIASISVVKYGENFGFLGFYIVRPEFRGRGYGWQLWQAGFRYLQGRNIGLDGVVEQQDNYVKSGFNLAHRNVRFEGKKEDSTPIKAPLSSVPLLSKEATNLSPLSSIPLSTIVEYDSAIFQENRAAFLEGWVSSPHHIGVGIVSEQTLLGYGVLRPCQQGYKIGPLFADTAEFAEAIFLALIAQIEPGSIFYLDAPAVNEAAMALAKKHHMTSVFETARMYTQTPPELPLNRIFGITTFELG